MSDQSQGEGWWLASDGKWYPPPSPDVPAQPPVTARVDPAGASPTQPFGPPSGPPTETSAFSPPTGPPVGVPPGAPPVGSPGAPLGEPKKSGLGRGPIIAIAAAAIIVIAALVGFFLTRDDGKKDNVAATTSDRTDQSDRSDASDKSTDASSDSASASSQVKVPSGFKVIKDDKEGVSIAVPKNFAEIDPSEFLNSSNQSEFSSQNPELAPFLSSGNTFLNGAVLAAMGQSGGNPAVVIVAKSPERIDPTDSGAASQLEDVFRSAGGTNVTTDTVTLPAGTALRTGFTLDINAGASSSSVSETIYLVTVGRTTWAIFGVSVGGDAGELFDQIANTFTVSS